MTSATDDAKPTSSLPDSEGHEASSNAIPQTTDSPVPDESPSLSSTSPEVDVPASLSVPRDNTLAEAATASTETPAPSTPESRKKWYVVKVQSGREDSIRNAIERRVKIEGLEDYFGRILIPTEKVMEVKNGKRVEKRRKKFPGYLMCEVEFNDKILYLFRETSGVGDFVGGSLHKIPPPMSDREVERMLLDTEQEIQKTKGKAAEEGPSTKVVLNFSVGDRVKVLHGMFKDAEGEVKEIIEPRDKGDHPKVKVVVMFWGRPVDVEVDYWHVDPI